MPFTTALPPFPILPPIPTVWTDPETGRLTREAQDYMIRMDQYDKALRVWLAAFAAAVP